ncbi:protein FAR-RED IMPAIRED RESPONSE 1-like [Henckelia pumila]|uniref:protein FAR-RED IMPAIRED RESPONSE 1-like n=1 Tax=Henckelia pumila TaxID=405737 RepID=UPI003C6DE8A7
MRDSNKLKKINPMSCNKLEPSSKEKELAQPACHGGALSEKKSCWRRESLKNLEEPMEVQGVRDGEKIMDLILNDGEGVTVNTNFTNEDSKAENFEMSDAEKKCVPTVEDFEQRLAIGQTIKRIKDGKRSANNNRPLYQNLETRTKCKERLRIRREKNDDWKVVIFEIEHNHEMVNESQRYLLRSARKVSYAQGETLRVMSEAGIKPSSVLSYMEKESHGVENLGFIRKDAYNYLNYVTKGHSRVENGDAFELIRYFKTKSNEEDLFYWDIQMDENGRLSNFFYTDSRARIDFEYFGDVFSFDTTYRTNRYNLICAPFVGINHHMDNVIFVLAFMSDETETSFQWLFKTFLESMGGKQPEIIFTDQCQAMMNAIESFCYSEKEFDEVRKKMISEFGLENHSWLRGMHKLRHKWSTAFSNDKFCVGLKATSRSECTNSILKDGGKRNFTLFEFVKRFEEIQKRWRIKENEKDYKCRHKMPTLVVKNQPLLQHAASVYTIDIYKIFEKELVNALNIEFDHPPTFTGNPMKFDIRSVGQ